MKDLTRCYWRFDRKDGPLHDSQSKRLEGVHMRQSLPSLDLDNLHLDCIYAGGRWQAANSKKFIEVISPYDGAIAARVCAADHTDIDRTVAAARTAFDDGSWAELQVIERIEWIQRLTRAIATRTDELAVCWTRQIGVPYSRAKMITPIFAKVMDGYIEGAREFEFVQSKDTKAAATGLLVHEPVGVVAAITPWNVPLSTMLHKIGPAMLAGCTVIMKPAPETPLEAYIIAQCAHDIGLPAGVLNLACAAAETSSYLANNALVDKVTFTGSVATGQAIAQSCGSRIARVSLELGGKSAAIVLDDANLSDVAVLLVKGICSLSGQNCAVLSRVLVHRERQGELVDEMRKIATLIVPGHPLDDHTEMGPVATRKQFDRVMEYIRVGIAEGAVLETGGKSPPELKNGFYIEPTIFSGVTSKMRIAQEEIFGPVICVMPFDTLNEAIAIANDSEFGLSGAVFTKNNGLAYQVARKLRTGTVAQNGAKADFGIGFGGFKKSGIGREGGLQGLKAFLETKTLLLDGRALS
jgi:aldehyde dehydrogenase (NAD+)